VPNRRGSSPKKQQNPKWKTCKTAEVLVCSKLKDYEQTFLAALTAIYKT